MIEDYEAGKESVNKFNDQRVSENKLIDYNVLVVNDVIWKESNQTNQNNELIIPNELNDLYEFKEITNLNNNFEKFYLELFPKRKIIWDNLNSVIEIEANFNNAHTNTNTNINDQKCIIETSCLHGLILLLFNTNKNKCKSQNQSIEFNQLLKAFSECSLSEEITNCLQDFVRLII